MLEKYFQKLPFYDHTWFQFVLFVIKRFEADRCREQAGSLTYTTLFAVVPMLTVFLVIISSINALEPARQQLQQLIYSNFLPKTTIAFDKALNAFTSKSSNLTVIGILFLFVTTVLMLTSIETVFNRIWRVRETRGGIVGFMRYWTIISLGPILLGSAFVISSTITSMNVLSSNFAGYNLDGTYLFGFISFALTILGFFILYWMIPNRPVPAKAAMIAAAFSATIFVLLKNLFGFVMANFTSYEIIYGAFAAVPIFLLWIFLSWNIILLGVELSYALTAFNAHKESNRHPVIMLMDLLQLFYNKQKKGEAVSDAEALDVLGREEIGRWPSHLNILMKNNLIKCTGDDKFVLVRNLNEVDFWQFYKMLPYPLPRREDIIDITQDKPWLQDIGPALLESDAALTARLSVPLSQIFEDNSRSKL